MNYHSDDWIMSKIKAHYEEALKHFPSNRIVGIFNQGSANYGLDVESSDVDTKLIVTPSLIDIALNKQPISTTYVLDNDEHIDFKDIRLYCDTFKKQNLNFLEILFTKYKIVNPLYADQWNQLVEAREAIAHYSPIRAIKSMTGLAHTKYKNLTHESPASIPFIEKYQYVPKELHHLIRIWEYLVRYVSGESYEQCLVSNIPEILKKIKSGFYSCAEAQILADMFIDEIDRICDEYINKYDVVTDQSVESLLQDVQYNIIKISIKQEIAND